MADVSDEELAEMIRLNEDGEELSVKAVSSALTELQARRAAEAKAVEALPPGRSKQDVANLVDAAIQDSLVELDDLGGHRYDYDIMQEKLRANGLTIAALGASQ